MSHKIKMSEIQLGELNSNCLVWISKFIRELKAQNGTVIRMQDEDALVRIIHEAKQTNNVKLQKTYDALKSELKTYLNSPEASARVVDRMVEDLTHRAESHVEHKQ